MTNEEIISTIENCRYCLMCRHVASVEYVTHKETLSPHGWALVIASVYRGLLDWTADTVDVIFSAPDNGNSRAHCVTNQPLPEAIAAVRAEIVSRNLAPPIVYELDQAFREWGTPFAKRQPGKVVGEGDVALFVGDEAQYLWPKALSAALRLLEILGVQPILIGVGRSNGFLASSLGLLDTARRLAQDNLKDLEESGAQNLLVLSPGDLFTFTQLYPERLGIPWPAQVEVVELTSYLADGLKGGDISFRVLDADVPFAYVDPTHAVRVPGRHETPRKLVSACLRGEARELFWRRERAHPVGSTALQFTKPDIAEKLTRARLEDAQRSGARLLITEDPGTLKQLNRYAEEYHLRLTGLFELLAEHVIKDDGRA